MMSSLWHHDAIAALTQGTGASQPSCAKRQGEYVGGSVIQLADIAQDVAGQRDYYGISCALVYVSARGG